LDTPPSNNLVAWLQFVPKQNFYIILLKNFRKSKYLAGSYVLAVAVFVSEFDRFRSIPGNFKMCARFDSAQIVRLSDVPSQVTCQLRNVGDSSRTPRKRRIAAVFHSRRPVVEVVLPNIGLIYTFLKMEP